MKSSSLLGAAAAAVLVFAGGQAFAAPSNVNEPSGNVILDLDGTAISHSWTTLTATFVAAATSTDIGFAFRDDPRFIYFDNASVTAGGGNLLVNGDFETGNLAGWTYQNPNAASYSGVVVAGDGNPGFGWFDGSVQAYDTLDQTIATVVGTTYTLTFDYREDSGQGTFSRLSTNGDVSGIGGNGINLVVYAGASAPVLQGGVPEPASWALMLLGFGGLGAVLRHRRTQTAITAI